MTPRDKIVNKNDLKLPDEFGTNSDVYNYIKKVITPYKNINHLLYFLKIIYKNKVDIQLFNNIKKKRKSYFI